MKTFYRRGLALLLAIFFAATISAQTNKIAVRPKINRIVTGLQKDRMVYFGYPVGYGGSDGTKIKYYKLYKKLMHKATNEELIELTKNKSANIIIYAFKILYIRNYNGLKNIFLDNINDSTQFWTSGGCTGVVNQVNWFMLWLLKPMDKDNSKVHLTKEEYDFYCNKFSKENKYYTCE